MTGLWIGVFLLLGNAFFVGAEFAIISARRSQIEPLAQAGSRRARIALLGMERVSLMLAGAQLGITVCSIGLGAVAEPALAHLIEPLVLAVGLPAGSAHSVAFVIALLIVVYLHIVIGEMVPKNLSLATPERSALWLGPPLWWITWLLRPVLWILNGLANLGLWVLRIKPKDEVAAAFTTDEVASLISESRREGLLDDRETELASGALDLGAVTAGQLTIAVDALRALHLADSPADVLQATVDTGFSRFPVLGPDGAAVGYLHVRDVLGLPADTRMTLADLALRSLPVVAASATAGSVAEILRTQGAHLARVVAVDGSDVGLIALEDVLEELIGEVRDSAHR